MTTLTYIAATSACMALIVTVGLLAAHVETTRREREMVRRPREWRNGRVEGWTSGSTSPPLRIYAARSVT